MRLTGGRDLVLRANWELTRAYGTWSGASNHGHLLGQIVKDRLLSSTQVSVQRVDVVRLDTRHKNRRERGARAPGIGRGIC